MDTGRSLVALAEQRQPGLAAAAHAYAGVAALNYGLLDEAMVHFQTSLARVPEPGVPVFVDLPALARLNLGRTLIDRGQCAAGLVEVNTALARSRAEAKPFDLLQTLYWAAEAQRMAGHADTAMPLYNEAADMATRFAHEGYLLAARFGSLACDPTRPGRRVRMAALVDRRNALGERWNAGAFQLALADALLADGAVEAASDAVAVGLAIQGPDTGHRHRNALLALQQRVQDASSVGTAPNKRPVAPPPVAPARTGNGLGA